MLAVRRWTQGDIDFVTESVAREGWGYIRRDMERCWRFELDGCFIAEVRDKPVGHVFSICYDKYGWIGLLIVNPEWRGKGVGAVLMQVAIDFLKGLGAETIRLEAVEKAVPLYKRLGFREEFDSLRFCKQLGQGQKLKRFVGNVFRVQEGEVEKIAEFDSKYFGVNRFRVLKALYKDEPEGCFVARDGAEVLGYLFSRKTVNARRVGPWVCKNLATAERLLRTCMEAVGEERELRVGMPVLNRDGVRLMRKLEFQLTSKSIRMVLGRSKYQGDVAGVYGIGGPEKG